MARMVSDPDRVILRDRGTTLIVDKPADEAVLERKFLFWQRKPVVLPLYEIDDVVVTSETDIPSGATLCHSVMVLRSGGTEVLTTEAPEEAEATVNTLREFIGLY